MTDTEATTSSKPLAQRIAWRLLLIGCGLALFVAAGITGAMVTLTWLI